MKLDEMTMLKPLLDSHLFEAVLLTHDKSGRTNASAVGFFPDRSGAAIRPSLYFVLYYGSNTFINLERLDVSKGSEKPIISINIIHPSKLHMLLRAGLYGERNHENEFEDDEYYTTDDGSIPYLKETQAVLLAELNSISLAAHHDEYGDTKVLKCTCSVEEVMLLDESIPLEPISRNRHPLIGVAIDATRYRIAAGSLKAELEEKIYSGLQNIQDSHPLSPAEKASMELIMEYLEKIDSSKA